MSLARFTFCWFFTLAAPFIISCWPSARADAGEPQSLGSMRFSGHIYAPNDIIGIGFLGKSLVIGDDEPEGDAKENVIQVLDPDGADYKLSSTVVLFSGGEMDL